MPVGGQAKKSEAIRQKRAKVVFIPCYHKNLSLGDSDQGRRWVIGMSYYCMDLLTFTGDILPLFLQDSKIFGPDIDIGFNRSNAKYSDKKSI